MIFDVNPDSNGSWNIPKDAPVDRSRSDLLGLADIRPGAKIATRYGIAGVTERYIVKSWPTEEELGITEEWDINLSVKLRRRWSPFLTTRFLCDMGVVPYLDGIWNRFNYTVSDQ